MFRFKPPAKDFNELYERKKLWIALGLIAFFIFLIVMIVSKVL